MASPPGRVTDLDRENLIGCDGGFMRVPPLEPSTRQRGVFQGRDVGSERLHVEAVERRPAHQFEKAFELPGFGRRLEGLAAGGTRNALTRRGSLW